MRLTFQTSNKSQQVGKSYMGAVALQTRRRVLIVDSDSTSMAMLVRSFTEAGMYTEGISSLAATRVLEFSGPFDLVLSRLVSGLSQEMPSSSTLTIWGHQTPTLYMGSGEFQPEMLLELERKNIEFIQKPFRPIDMISLAREVIQKNSNGDDSSTISFEDIEVDLKSRVVTRGPKQFELRNKELSLLVCLMRAKGETLSKMQLLELVWKYDFDPNTNVVDVLVCRLRDKVDQGFERSLIKTVRGVGYAIRSK